MKEVAIGIPLSKIHDSPDRWHLADAGCYFHGENRVSMMTDKQRRFADEYLIDQNATQAAIRAGYSPKTADPAASRLLANVNVHKYIDDQLAQMHNSKIADAEEVLEYLTSVVRGEHTEQTLKMTSKGAQDIVDVKVSEKDRLRAAELLGKAHGCFSEKVKMDVSLPVIMEGEDELEK